MMTGSAELIRYFYETVVSRHLLGELPGIVAGDCRLRAGEETFPMGPAEMAQHLAAVRQTYPDYTMRILRQHIAGEYVISEFVMEGTHLGEFCGIPPSGKRLTFAGVNVDRVTGGKMVEHGGAVNTFETLMTNGLIRGVPEEKAPESQNEERLRFG